MDVDILSCVAGCFVVILWTYLVGVTLSLVWYTDCVSLSLSSLWYGGWWPCSCALWLSNISWRLFWAAIRNWQ